MEDNKVLVFLSMVIGIFIGAIGGTEYVMHNYKMPMDALGIERFQKREINTTNCHSNWYEIVYKKDR